MARREGTRILSDLPTFLFQSNRRSRDLPASHMLNMRRMSASNTPYAVTVSA
jgi:hypothetical protein